MGHSANLRALDRLRTRREAKLAGGHPVLAQTSRGKTKHAIRRLKERAATVEFCFSLAAITDRIQKRQAIVSDAGGGLYSIIFPVNVDGVEVEFKVIAEMKRNKVIKIITVVNLDKSEAKQNN